MRATRPTTLDFREIADAVRKNNMGLGGIRFQASAAISGGKAVLQPTGQSIPLQGPTADEGSPAWRAFRVLEPADPAKTALERLPDPPPPGSALSAGTRSAP